MSEKKIKVTDKRLFTPEGELRDEFRHLEGESAAESQPSASSPAAEQQPEPEPEPTATAPAAEIESPASEPEARPPDSEYRSPTFFDLVGVVAQPIALYLGDAKMPNGDSMENLELARLYIDLLEILSERSAGNLSNEEKGFLDDLLYQLRLRYVEKTG